MSGPNLRMLVRNLREREEAQKKGKCFECGRFLARKPTKEEDGLRKAARIALQHAGDIPDNYNETTWKQACYSVANAIMTEMGLEPADLG